MNRKNRSGRRLAVLAALLVGVLPASVAHAQEAETRSLFDAVTGLMNRPVPEELRTELAPRWELIEARGRRLAEARGELAGDAAREAELAEAERRVVESRFGHSGTLMGRNGAVPGTDGQSIGRRNFERADRLVGEWATAGEPLSLERLLDINRVLGEGLQNNGHQPGTLRGPGHRVRAGGQDRWEYVEGEHVAQAMSELLEWYRASEERVRTGRMSPVEVAAGMYQRLITIHPFPDANGRSSRMAMDFVLRSHGLPAIAFRSGEHMMALFGRPVIETGLEPSDRPAGLAEKNVTNAIEQTLAELERGAGVDSNEPPTRWMRRRGLASEVEALAPELRAAVRSAFPRVHPMANAEIDVRVTDGAEPKVTARLVTGNAEITISRGLLEALERGAEGLDQEQARRFVRRALVLEAIAAADAGISQRLNVARAARESGVFDERTGLTAEERTRLRGVFERRGQPFPENIARRIGRANESTRRGTSTGLLGELDGVTRERVRDRTRTGRRARRGR